MLHTQLKTQTNLCFCKFRKKRPPMLKTSIIRVGNGRALIRAQRGEKVTSSHPDTILPTSLWHDLTNVTQYTQFTQVHQVHPSTPQHIPVHLSTCQYIQANPSTLQYMPAHASRTQYPQSTGPVHLSTCQQSLLSRPQCTPVHASTPSATPPLATKRCWAMWALTIMPNQVLHWRRKSPHFK